MNLSFLDTSTNSAESTKRMKNIVAFLPYNIKKLAILLSMYSTIKLIMRNKFSNYTITLTEEQKISESCMTNFDKSKLVDEIKCAMLARRNASSKMYPWKVIVAWPQERDEVCYEHESDIINVTNDDDNYELSNISSDGLSSEGNFSKSKQ